MSEPEVPVPIGDAVKFKRPRAALHFEDEIMPDDYNINKTSIESRLGYVEGKLDSLRDQVKEVSIFNGARFGTLETKVDQGFKEVFAEIARHFEDLGKRTTDLAEKLARGQGAVSVLDRVLGWVVPCLLGGVATMLLFHLKAL
jgi:hypothetical protein